MNRLILTRGTTRYRCLKGGLIIAGVALVSFLPFFYGPYRSFQLTMVMVWALGALGLNLLTGYAGQISLAHGSFIAVGAYTTSILVTRYEWHYAATIPVAAILSYALGYLLGLPALRLKGLYLALVTLAVAIATPALAKRFEGLTGGTQGIIAPKPDAPGGLGLADDQWRYLFTFVVVVACFVLTRNLLNGAVGRAVVAMRDNEVAAEAMGVPLRRYKTRVFAHSAMLGGIAGSVYAMNVGIVAPDSFTLMLSVSLLAAAVVGGAATVTGAVIGGAFIEFTPSVAASINQALGGFIYGAVLIAIMLLLPRGAMGLLVSLRDRFMAIQDPPPPPTLDAQQAVETSSGELPRASTVPSGGDTSS